MGHADKFDAHMDDLKGKAKEAVGKMRGDDSQVAEGKADQVKADLKKAGENVKDAAKETFSD